MNCENVSTLLDNRAQRNLTAAERCDLEAHLAVCADCARAWHAQEALLAQPVPATPPTLLDDTLRLLASQTAPAAPRRYSSRAVVGTVVLAAGAALAAITIVSQTVRNGDESVPAATSPPIASTPATGEALIAAEQAAQTKPASDDAGDSLAFPDGDYFSLLLVPPEYPLEALKEQAEARVVMEFTITRDGTVADATVVESSDSRFDAAATLAVERWKYMPRVVNGKRVAARGIRTVIRFEFAHEPDDQSDGADPESLRGGPPLSDLLAPAWECAAVRDLLCAQQVLDEVSAAYELVPFEQRQVLAFYGYLYTQYADYERAIDAYRSAVEVVVDGAASMTQLTLAHLYFTRQQYQLALDTALEYSKALETAGRDRAQAGPSRFVEKLLALGITPSKP
jgi:TonB family protein